jgi:hypothetical protein
MADIGQVLATGGTALVSVAAGAGTHRLAWLPEPSPPGGERRKHGRTTEVARGSVRAALWRRRDRLSHAHARGTRAPRDSARYARDGDKGR